jgi:hypothetical protein
MNYFVQAQKFVQSARHARSPEVIKRDLEIAEWLLSRGMEQGDSVHKDRGSAWPPPDPNNRDGAI